MQTIREAKEFLRENFEKGTYCPCCAQPVKLYKRKIHSSIANNLIRLYKMGEGYHHINDFVNLLSGKEIALLKHWKLVEQDESEFDEDKKTSGKWKITPTGKLFVENKVKVPEYAYLYNNKCYRLEQNSFVDIKKALGNKFSYSELMGESNGED